MYREVEWIDGVLMERSTPDGAWTPVDVKGYIGAIQHDRNRVSELYHELLYCVWNKCEGETRHETALRYLKNAERHNNTPQQDTTAPAPGQEGGGNG